ncbi:MAG: bacteriophage protein [Parcubacteria group bacterium Gr01-1014_24]|nr:MAG: bacteriophage protein [Parcubacteria group bacterium Gr01-1014_24]
MKKCSKCKKEKSLSEFSFKIKATGLRHRQCKECTRLLIRNHYNSNRQYYLLKARKRNKTLRDKVNVFLCQHLLKNPCVDCGESDVTVLEFDHKGIVPKLKAVSQLARAHFPIDKIQKEIDKCEVRCANCHRRKTAQVFNWFKNKSARSSTDRVLVFGTSDVGSIPAGRTK